MTVIKGAYAEITIEDLQGSKFCPDKAEDLTVLSIEELGEQRDMLTKSMRATNNSLSSMGLLVGSGKYVRKKYIVTNEGDLSYVYADYVREFIFMQALSPYTCFPHKFDNVLNPEVVISMQYYDTDLNRLVYPSEEEPSVRGTNLPSIIEDLGRAMTLMHDRGIYHGDIKPDNILYDRTNRRWALCDFNKSMFRGQQTMKDSWSIGYSHPDLIAKPGLRYSAKCDYWSLAACFYFYVTGGLQLSSANQFNFDFFVKYSIWGNYEEYLKGLVNGVNRYNELISDVNEMDFYYDGNFGGMSTALVDAIGDPTGSGKDITPADLSAYQEAIRPYWSHPIKKIKPRYVAGAYYLFDMAGYEDLPEDDINMACLYFIYAVICKDVAQYEDFLINDETISALNNILKPMTPFRVPCGMLKYKHLEKELVARKSH